MANPLISFCMATHRDFHGTFFTVQQFKANNPELLKRCELVIVDQSPESPEGAEVKKLCGYSAECFGSVKYVPYTERIGTSPSRQKAIEEATGDIVVMVDCHVVLLDGAIKSILDYYADHLHAKDMVSGPLLTDAIYRHDPAIESYDPVDGPFAVLATHYADHWRAEMWGTWGNAYQCTCGDFNFTTWNDGDLVHFETLSMRPQRIKHCQSCNKRFPMISWAGHEAQLRQLGYVELSHSKTPFEIPGQGLGMFAMRREAWPNFCPDTWGFGGEELWIHEKVRMAGGKVVCIPAAKWYHRFPRPEMAKYPNTTWYKARNYVVEFQQVGWSLDPIKEHFVDGNKVHPKEWEAMTTDPQKFIHGPTDMHIQPVMVNGVPAATMKASAEAIYNELKSLPRDLNQHMPTLRELADECESICEFSKRRESAAVWAASSAKAIEIHNVELGDQRLQAALVSVKDEKALRPDNRNSLEVEAIAKCDLLFIDTVHHADRLRTELAKFAGSVSKFIVVRGTGNFGVTAEGGGEGLFAAMREFVFDNPQWFVYYHTSTQYGITVLCCDPSRKPDKPIIPWPPGKGVGTELYKINIDLGIRQVPGCGCIQLQNHMDLIGPDGCEEHFDKLVAEMKAKSPGWGWKYVGIVYNALTSGLYKEVSPMDPIPGLLRLAIDRARGKAAAENQAGEPIIYFDIDGVLNNTPARGNLGFGADADKCELLASIPGKKVCISFWRGADPGAIKLPFDFTLAPNGDKRNCHEGATIIIDDQPNLYNADAPVYAVNGRVGLTATDVQNIKDILAKKLQGVAQ